jgi:Acetyltransferase (GNAT) domain
VRHVLVPIGDPAGWQAALTGITHSHAHTHTHVAAFAASSADETFLYSWRDDDDAPMVACPLSLRGETGAIDVYTPYGFSGFAARAARPDFAGDYDAFAASEGWVASYVFQHPMLVAELGFPSKSLLMQAKCAVIDLGKSESELMACMSPGRRRELRRWAREAAVVTTDRDEVLAFVLATADDFFDTRDASSVYRFTEQTWASLLGGPSVWCIGVREAGRLVSASIFAESCGIVEYLFGLSSVGASTYAAPLIWEAILHYSAEGASSFNLGGGIRPDDGVAEFKRRFGADDMPAMSGRFVHDADKYSRLCARAAVGEDTTGFFPPYRRRRS